MLSARAPLEAILYTGEAGAALARSYIYIYIIWSISLLWATVKWGNFGS